MAENARNMGVNENTLYTVGLTNIANLLKTERIDAHLYDELQQLKRENTRLRQERDFRTRRRIGRLMAELGLACKVKRTTKRP